MTPPRSAAWQRIVRTLSLRRNGYFGGRQVRGSWVYEERCGAELLALSLEMVNMEPGRWELFVPGEAKWREVVPAWAADRRSEIIQRIAERLAPDRIRDDA